MIVSNVGAPIELIIAPGGPSDTKIMKDFNFDLPEGAFVYGDKAFNDYLFEDFLKEWSKVNLIPVRKKNSLRPIDPHFLIWLKRVRQRCETAFSQITALFPKTIHAVTAKGFESKVMLFVIAFAIQCL